MKKFLLSAFLLFPAWLFAAAENSEWFVCIISDSDGYTLVRSGPHRNNPVVDTVFAESFFYVYGDTSGAWLHVQTVYGETGYMHKSRIQFFHQLDSAHQHKLIEDAFNEIIHVEQTDDREQRNSVYERKYIPAYSAFQKMYCRNPDAPLLRLYFRTLLFVNGSADEGKDWTSAEMWLCRPAEVQHTICSLNTTEQRYAINSIETGMAISGKENLFTPSELQERYTALEKPCQ